MPLQSSQRGIVPGPSAARGATQSAAAGTASAALGGGGARRRQRRASQRRGGAPGDVDLRHSHLSPRRVSEASESDLYESSPDAAAAMASEAAAAPSLLPRRCIEEDVTMGVPAATSQVRPHGRGRRGCRGCYICLPCTHGCAWAAERPGTADVPSYAAAPS
eukprot:364327-Chlamydomonas_euryale.AAC.10